MESIEHVQVFDHHQGVLLVELIGADERGSTTVQSYACKLDGDGVAHLPSDVEGSIGCSSNRHSVTRATTS